MELEGGMRQNKENSGNSFMLSQFQWKGLKEMKGLFLDILLKFVVAVYSHHTLFFS